MFKKIILPMVFLTMGIAGVVLAYRAGHPLQAYLFHSDSLYLPTLFQDVFSGGGRLSDWFLTPAPYFFPDFAFYLPAYLAGSSAYEQILIFATLQTVLTTVALFFVVKAVLPRYRIATTALIAVALVWFGLNAAEPFVELFTSAYHFGAFLSTLAFVALWLRWDRDDNRRALAATCLLAFLTTLSDNIFLVQAIAPFVATGLLLRQPAATKGVRRLTASMLVLAAGVLGSLSYKLVVAHPTRYPTKLGLSQLDANLRDLFDLLSRLFIQFPLLGVLFCAYIVFGVACLIACVRKRSFLGLPHPLRLLVVFSIISMAATIAAVLLVRNLPVSPRYLIPVLMWPLIIGVLLVQHFLRGRLGGAAVYGTAVFCFLIIAGVSRLEGAKAGQAGYYPEQIACLDNALEGSGLHHGIAQYWDAKHIQAFSRRGLTLAQYVDDLNQHKWITSERFYRDTYDFAIISDAATGMFKLPADKLIEINGPPAKIAACRELKILIYGPDKLRLNKIGNAGASYRWKGCELPTLIGKPTATCEVEKSDPGQDGFLTFGPYETLPAGTYAYEVEYASSKPTTEVAGEWDIALALPTEAKRLQAGALPGTDGKLVKIGGKFTVPKEHDRARIEIRHLSNKGGTMKVASLRLTRLD
jgi:hypothetical protein